MRVFYKIAHWLIGLLLAISTMFQLLAMVGGVLANDKNNFTETIPWLIPVWSGMLALLIAVFVLLVIKRHRYPWPPILLVGAVVGAVAAFVVAVTLRDALPDSLSITGETQGLTTWRLLYRHMSSVLVGGLMALLAGARWLFCHIERRNAAYDMNVSESTIGLESYAGDEESPAPKPRKYRRRKK